MASICFIWLLVPLQAFKGIQVLPVADSFSNQEMRTFSRIRAHQSTNETLKTSLWRRETKPSSLNYFAVVVLATNKTCSASPWRVSVFSLLWNNMLKITFHQNVRELVSFFNQYSCSFFRYRPIRWLEADIVASHDSVSHLIYRVFRWSVVLDVLLLPHCCLNYVYSHRYVAISL